MPDRSQSKPRALKKPVRLWALVNHGTVHEVAYYRRDCVAAGIAALGSKAEYERFVREGSYIIVRVEVREVK